MLIFVEGGKPENPEKKVKAQAGLEILYSTPLPKY
jgi:hypothetical protein